MKPRSISILGCGWLGMALALELIKDGWVVKGSTTTEEKVDVLREAGILPYLIRLTPEVSGDSSDDFFASDLVLISIPPRRKAGQTELYQQQMRCVVEVLKSKPQCRVIFISSTSIYEGRQGEVVEQDANPASYLFSVEQSIRDGLGDRATILRFAGLAGPGRHPGRFFAGKADVPGADIPVNFIHLIDCIGIIKAIADRACWGETFNACAGLHPTKKVFYTHASKKLNLPPPTFNAAKGDSDKVINSTKLQKKLGYVFRYNDPMEMLEVL